MKIPVRPELPTAALRSSQATHAAVDNSAPSTIRPESTYKSGKVVQTSGATSVLDVGCGCGGLGLALAERFGVSRYTGVEINAAAVAESARRLRADPVQPSYTTSGDASRPRKRLR